MLALELASVPFGPWKFSQGLKANRCRFSRPQKPGGKRSTRPICIIADFQNDSARNRRVGPYRSRFGSSRILKRLPFPRHFSTRYAHLLLPVSTPVILNLSISDSLGSQFAIQLHRICSSRLLDRKRLRELPEPGSDALRHIT